MYCPKCKSEYQEGMKRCESCNVDLVIKLVETEHPENHFEELLSTFNPADIAITKSILENEGIEYYFKGENFISIRPMIDPARLMVRADQIELVKELIKDLELNYSTW